MSMNEQTRSFHAFVAGTSGDLPVSRREQIDRWIAIRASAALGKPWRARIAAGSGSITAGASASADQTHSRIRCTRSPSPLG